MVKVKTSTGELVRPIQRLIPLEVLSDGSYQVSCQTPAERDGEPVEIEVKTRRGRRIVTPARYSRNV